MHGRRNRNRNPEIPAIAARTILETIDKKRKMFINFTGTQSTNKPEFPKSAVIYLFGAPNR